MSSYLGFEPSEEKNAFFVSYNTEDGPRIRPILCKLNEMGVPLWYDHGLEYGKKWAEQIAVHIDESQAVILFFSKGILQKENSYVQKEYKMAKEFYEKQVFVVLLDRITKKDVPYDKVAWWIDIQAEQNIDAIGAPADDAFCRKLAAAIGAELRPEKIAEAAPVPEEAPVVEENLPEPEKPAPEPATAEKKASEPSPAKANHTPAQENWKSAQEKQRQLEAQQQRKPAPKTTEPATEAHVPAQESWKVAQAKQRQLEAEREKALQQQKSEIPQQAEESQLFQVVRGVGSLMRGVMQAVKTEPERPTPEPEPPTPQVPPEESWKLAQAKQRQLEAERTKQQEKFLHDLAIARQVPNYEKTPAQENWKEVLQRQQTKK